MNQKNESTQEQNQAEAGSESKQRSEPAHKCSICGSPDHRACGCEGRAAVREGLTPVAAPVKPQNIVVPVDIAVRVTDVLEKSTETLFLILRDIQSELKAVAELEKERATLLKDILNDREN